jgi:hypothetical protein
MATESIEAQGYAIVPDVLSAERVRGVDWHFYRGCGGFARTWDAPQSLA